MKELQVSNELRQTLNTIYSNHLTDIQNKIKNDAAVNSLIIKTYTSCCEQFQHTLLQLIFKPEAGSCHYESLIDLLNYFTTKIFPGLEEVQTLSKFPPNIRRKEFAKSGDKILLYLEQYIDIIDNGRY